MDQTGGPAYAKLNRAYARLANVEPEPVDQPRLWIIEVGPSPKPLVIKIRAKFLVLAVEEVEAVEKWVQMRDRGAEAGEPLVLPGEDWTISLVEWEQEVVEV